MQVISSLSAVTWHSVFNSIWQYLSLRKPQCILSVKHLFRLIHLIQYRKNENHVKGCSNSGSNRILDLSRNLCSKWKEYTYKINFFLNLECLPHYSVHPIPHCFCSPIDRFHFWQLSFWTKNHFAFLLLRVYGNKNYISTITRMMTLDVNTKFHRLDEKKNKS